MSLLLVCNPLIKIGGAQDYTIKKAIDLKEFNFGIVVLCSEISNEYRVILDANKISFIVRDELKINPMFFSVRKREKIITEILDSDLLSQIKVIESHQVFPMLWGELLAERLRITNLVYILSSESSFKRYLKDFIVGKALQNQLIGCNSIYLKTIFNEINYSTDYNSYINISIDTKSVSEKVSVSNELLSQLKSYKKKFGLRILTISRLEKNYILSLLNDLIRTAIEYPEKYFHLTIVGEGENKELLEKISKNHRLPNLSVYFTGFLKPIPLNLYENHDLYIGGGTTIILAASNKLPSIVGSHKVEGAIGYFGDNATDFGGGEYEKIRSYSSYLEEIINNKHVLLKASNDAFNFYNNEFSETKIFNDFITIYKENELKKQTKYLVKIQLHGLEKFRKLIYYCFGKENFIKFSNFSIKAKNRYDYYYWKWK